MIKCEKKIRGGNQFSDFKGTLLKLPIKRLVNHQISIKWLCEKRLVQRFEPKYQITWTTV